MLDTADFLVRELLEAGRISESDVERAKSHAAQEGLGVVESLGALGIVTSRVLAIARAKLSECPFVDLESFEINIRNAEALPRGVAEKAGAFPLFNVDGVVAVGMIDPMDLRAVDQIRQLLKTEIDPVLCDESALRALIDRAYSMAPLRGPVDAPSDEDDDLTTGEEPIVAAVNHIIASAIEEHASDIHINPDERDLHLRYRIDGVLQPRQGPSLAAHAAIVQRIKVMANLDLTQTRRPQDGKFRFQRRGESFDVRISTIPTICGENVVMRLLARTSAIKGFEELGIPPDMADALRQAITRPYGMILATGPTGSGKTTTLYTALSQLNSPNRNIMTIEDPVEIRLQLVRQTQVNPEIGLTFAAALRSILRQDPDVVLVGEIRDQETAQIAVQAALTGHLMLSTLHTNDALGAVTRLQDLGVPGFAINSALLCVVAQRLVRRVCDACRAPFEPDEATLRAYGLAPGDSKGFVRGMGCARCLDTGYRGRIGVYELFRMTPRAQAAIEGAASPQALAAASAADGMRLMWRDGLDKARLGLTTIEELAKIRSGFDDAVEPLTPASDLRLSA